MSTYLMPRSLWLQNRFVQRKLWSTLLITTYLLATIMPASRAWASTTAEPCGNVGLQQATVAADQVASANDQVKISKESVELAALEATWNKRYTDAEKVHQLFIEFMILQKMVGPQALQEFEVKFAKAIPPVDLNNQNLYPYDDILHTMYDVALTIPEMESTVPIIWQKMNDVGAAGSADALWFGDNAAKVSASSLRYSQAARLIATSSQILAQAHDCAKTNPAYAEGFDQRNGEKLKASITDSVSEFLAKNADITFPGELQGRINQDGTLTVSLDELKNFSEIELGKIHASIDRMQETLVEIDEQQKVIVDYLKDQELKAKQQELARKTAEEELLQLDAAEASITILSTLLNQLDPEIGKQFTVVSASTMQVGMALNGWLKSVSGLNGLDKLTSMSTVIMTGNVLGAVMNVISLFGPEEPTPEQMILDEIGKLRQQVDQMRSEMHSRFDRIDAGLSSIYTTLQDRFNQVDIQLGKIDGKIEEVQHSLVEIDLKLSRIEYNTIEMLNALGRRPLLEAINWGLDYEGTTGNPMPYEPQFIEFANLLYTWGTLHAFDALEAGPSQSDYSDGNVLAVLNAYGSDSNLNYLNGWLAVHNTPTIANKRLASPRDWLLASRAFTQLGVEWPDHMGRYDAQRQVELDKVGSEIQAAMRNISTIDTPDGPQGNHLLYSNVITYYQSKLDALITGIQVQVETPFVQEVVTNRLHQNTPFDLFGGIEQPLAYESASIIIVNCGSLASLDAPTNLKNLIDNFDRYKLAEYLGLGEFSICVDAGLQNPQEVCLPKQEECHKQGKLNVGLTVSFDGVELLSRGVAAGMVTIDDSQEVTDYVFEHWGELKASFESDNDPYTPTPQQAAQQAALLAKMTEEMHKRFFAFQQELYGRVLNALLNGSLRPLAVELAGSKALLERFVSLGLSRAANEDELLHAMLFGNQSVMGESQIVQTYSISSTQPITNVNLWMNPRLIVQATANDRLAEFSKMIHEYLDAITQGDHVEVADYISNTRKRLELMTLITHMASPEPNEVAIAGLQATSDGPTLLGSATNFAAVVSAGTNVSYQWDFGDLSTATGATTSHIFTQSGSYVVKVTASNPLGQSTDEVVVQVHTPNPNEVAVAGLSVIHDGPTVLGESTNFAAVVTAGTNVSYAWEFGDGSVAVGATATHTYDQPGLYVVKVTASNSANQASAEMQVRVKPIGSSQSDSALHLPLIER